MFACNQWAYADNCVDAVDWLLIPYVSDGIARNETRFVSLVKMRFTQTDIPPCGGLKMVPLVGNNMSSFFFWSRIIIRIKIFISNLQCNWFCNTYHMGVCYLHSAVFLSCSVDAANTVKDVGHFL